MTTKKTILTVLLIIIGSTAFSQYTFQKLYSTSFANSATFFSMVDNEDGTYALTGKFSNKIFLLKIDSLGNRIWQKFYGSTSSFIDQGFNIERTTDNNYIISGIAFMPYTGTGSRQIFLLKTDTSGNVIWSKTFGTDLDDSGKAFLCQDKGFLIMGDSPDSITNIQYAFLLKTDSLGQQLWSQKLSIQLPHNLTSFLEYPDSSFLLSGSVRDTSVNTYSTMLLIKINKHGGLVWQKKYSFTGFSSWRAEPSFLNDSTLVFAGQCYDSTGHEKGALLVTDTLGNVQLGKIYFKTGSTSSAEGLKEFKKIDYNSYVLLSGGFGTLYLDSMFSPIELKSYLLAAAYFDYKIRSDKSFIVAGSTGLPVIIKTDSSGNGCTPATYPYSELTISVTESIPNYQFVPASIADSIGINAFTFTSQMFTLCSTNVGLEELSYTNEILVHPNPATDEIKISGIERNAIGELRINNINGGLSYNSLMSNFKDEVYSLNISNLNSGVYIIEWRSDKLIRRAKILKL